MGYNIELEDRIDHFFINNEVLTKNKEPEGVGWLINGNICFGIFNDLLVVRSDPKIADRLLQQPNISLFPHQKGKEDFFLSISENIYKDDEALHKFLNHAVKYSATLPSKEAASLK